jgi:hypothetical protein
MAAMRDVSGSPSELDDPYEIVWFMNQKLDILAPLLTDLVSRTNARIKDAILVASHAPELQSKNRRRAESFLSKADCAEIEQAKELRSSIMAPLPAEQSVFKHSNPRFQGRDSKGGNRQQPYGRRSGKGGKGKGKGQ